MYCSPTTIKLLLLAATLNWSSNAAAETREWNCTAEESIGYKYEGGRWEQVTYNPNNNYKVINKNGTGHVYQTAGFGGGIDLCAIPVGRGKMSGTKFINNGFLQCKFLDNFSFSALSLKYIRYDPGLYIAADDELKKYEEKWGKGTISYTRIEIGKCRLRQ